MPPMKYQVVSPSAGISCHAWNADKSMLALCANDNRLQIYEGCNNPSFASWRLAHVLEEHDLVISGISWSPVTNKIVTCSHDRNAFVWSYDAAQGKWNPILCALMLNRAALDVHWSPSGTKFACSSGAKTIAVSRLDRSQGSDWYVSKLIKGHKSTVQQVAWHPNGLVLATACTDFKCRVVSAVVEEVDTNPDPRPFGTVKPFGEAYHQFSCGGWVTAVAWSPSGSILAYAGQDSTIHFVRFDPGGAVSEQRVRYAFLPVSSLVFLSDKAVVGGGHDMNPLVFTAGSSGQWSFLRRLDEKSTGPEKAAGAVSSMSAARAMFQAKTTRGQTSAGGAGKDLWTQHANAIVGMEGMGRAGDPTCSKLSSCVPDNLHIDSPPPLACQAWTGGSLSGRSQRWTSICKLWACKPADPFSCGRAFVAGWRAVHPALGVKWIGYAASVRARVTWEKRRVVLCVRTSTSNIRGVFRLLHVGTMIACGLSSWLAARAAKLRTPRIQTESGYSGWTKSRISCFGFFVF